MKKETETMDKELELPQNTALKKGFSVEVMTGGGILMEVGTYSDGCKVAFTDPADMIAWVCDAFDVDPYDFVGE